jgi:hypothetical protein
LIVVAFIELVLPGAGGEPPDRFAEYGGFGRCLHGGGLR